MLFVLNHLNAVICGTNMSARKLIYFIKSNEFLNLKVSSLIKKKKNYNNYRCGEGKVPSPDNKGCVDRNECIDFPCLNGGRCINQDPKFRYRCICPDGFWGENCELVQEGQTLKLGMGALAAILVCLLLILGK